MFNVQPFFSSYGCFSAIHANFCLKQFFLIITDIKGLSPFLIENIFIT